MERELAKCAADPKRDHQKLAMMMQETDNLELLLTSIDKIPIDLLGILEDHNPPITLLLENLCKSPKRVARLIEVSNAPIDDAVIGRIIGIVEHENHFQVLAECIDILKRFLGPRHLVNEQVI